MKIDKRKPEHWIYLLLFGINTLIALILRPLWRLCRCKGRIVLYGHKLNGNLLALLRGMREQKRDGFEPVFLTMDLEYHTLLSRQGIPSCWAGSPRCIALLSSANAIISDHGLHVLKMLIGRTDLKFIDVWHGIPFKGFDAEDFRVQHLYDEVWVASDLQQKLYVERYGFKAERVIVTGYARTDRLIKLVERPEDIRRRLGLPVQGRVILFAPTWAQDTHGRSIYPFALGEKLFLQALSHVAEKYDATVILRSHLNSGAVDVVPAPRIVVLSGSKYPDAEEILQVSDLLICDWSSIAFDFLLLDRPTFFLDVPPPFFKGFSLGSEYRFGPVLGQVGHLTAELDLALGNYEGYRASGSIVRQAMKQQIYGTWADGKALDRYMQQLQAALDAP